MDFAFVAEDWSHLSPNYETVVQDDMYLHMMHLGTGS